MSRNKVLIFTLGITLFSLLLDNCTCSFGAVKLVPLLSFDGTNGDHPHCDLVEDGNGEFYGTTVMDMQPGGYLSGEVFKISADGAFSVLKTLDAATGGFPWTGLVLGTDGNLYGTATTGVTNSGTVLRMHPKGKLTVMAQFGFTNGSQPGDLVQGIDGNFYGITMGYENAGTNDTFYGANGTVFKMTPEGELTTLFAFDGYNGTTPWSLVQGYDGNLYGTTLGGGAYAAGTVFQITTNGTFSSLWNCDGTNGSQPVSVIQAADGNLYGGANTGGLYSNGTIFKLTTNGILTILHSFSQRGYDGQNADGSNPIGKLMQARDGCIYGGTQYGGSNLFNHGLQGGIGTLFKVNTNGGLTTLCSFGLCTNTYSTGATPNGLIQDRQGNFFGTTYFGGTNDTGNFGLGTVFKLVTVRPVLSITASRQDGPLTNAVRVISGRTKAEVQTIITNVLYQINGGAWTQAATADNWTNWNAEITFAPGTNVFRAYALDANGDPSRTNVLKLLSRTQ